MNEREYRRRCKSMRIMSARYEKPDSTPERLRGEAVTLVMWATRLGDQRNAHAIVGYDEATINKWRKAFERRQGCTAVDHSLTWRRWKPRHEDLTATSLRVAGAMIDCAESGDGTLARVMSDD